MTEQNSLLNHDSVRRSPREKAHRFNPYDRSEQLPHRNQRILNVEPVRSGYEVRQDQAYAVTSHNGKYYLNRPHGYFDLIQEDQAFHDNIARIRQTLLPADVPDESCRRRDPRIRTVSPSPSAAGLSTPNHVDSTRLRMNKEEETLSDLSTSCALPVPANLSAPATTRPDMPVVSQAPTVADKKSLGEQPKEHSRPAVGTRRLLEGPKAVDSAAAPVGGPPARVDTGTVESQAPTPTPLARAQAAKQIVDIERILANLNKLSAYARSHRNQQEIDYLDAQRRDIRQVLHDFIARRNIKQTPAQMQIAHLAAPTTQAGPNVGGQGKNRSNHAVTLTEKGAEEILLEAVSGIGQLAKTVAALEDSLKGENHNTTVQGLSMALVGAATELLRQTKEVTGYARNNERRIAGGQRSGGQRGGEQQDRWQHDRWQDGGRQRDRGQHSRGRRLLMEYNDRYDEGYCQEYDSEEDLTEYVDVGDISAALEFKSISGGLAQRRREDCKDFGFGLLEAAVLRNGEGLFNF
ncbi:MAG: hypothetical protein Q9216_006489 [Gyalolechia sp. 2 TL-2023]